MKLLLAAIAALISAITLTQTTHAQISRPNIYKGTVLQAEPAADQVTPPYQQTVVVEFEKQGQTKQTTINHGQMVMLNQQELVNPGDSIVLQEVDQGDQTNYWIVDYYRLPILLSILLIFILIVVFSAGKKGLGALVGMGISLIVILRFIIPQILAGANPLLISIIGSIGIITITLFLAHWGHWLGLMTRRMRMGMATPA